jgi:hypothetical protein
VKLLSTHASPIPPPRERPYVWHYFSGKRKKVPKSPMHFQYTRNMQGVDTADQLRRVYSCLTQSHKWWHHVFFYILDSTVSNMWIIHSDLRFRFLEDPLIHLFFQLQFAKDLAAKWAGRKWGYSIFAPLHLGMHGPKSLDKKRGNCQICGAQTNQACLGCQGHIYKGSCYWDIHW